MSITRYFTSQHYNCNTNKKANLLPHDLVGGIIGTKETVEDFYPTNIYPAPAAYRCYFNPLTSSLRWYP